MKTNTILLASMLTLFATSSATADERGDGNGVEHKTHQEKMHKHHKQRRKQHHKYMMKKMDANEDGVIDYDEYMANAKERFNTIDADGDGKITQEEHRNAKKAMREQHKQAMREARKAYKESLKD